MITHNKPERQKRQMSQNDRGDIQKGALGFPECRKSYGMNSYSLVTLKLNSNMYRNCTTTSYSSNT